LALQKVLGTHVEQKGSLVNPERLRFDFAHFQKMTNEEIREVEMLVNKAIRNNSNLQEYRETPIAEAQSMGAKALFGEKYGDTVRVIQFGESIELCGGTHIQATGNIGFFKIISEGAIAAGIRRIEGVTSDNAEAYIFSQIDTVSQVKELLKNPANVCKQLEAVTIENSTLRKQVETFERNQSQTVAAEILNDAKLQGATSIIIKEISASNAGILKDITFGVKEKLASHIVVLAANIDQKAHLAIAVSQDVIDNNKVTAPDLIKIASKEIEGGGGGQAFFATAGGKNPQGISKALAAIKLKTNTLQ
jgi:alanyl-tRNA synthetase